MEFIDYWRQDNIDSNLVLEYLKNSTKWNKNMFKRAIFRLLKSPSINRICRLCNDFLRQYIRLTNQSYYSLEDIKSNLPQADIYCTGSDQVWNKFYNKGVLREFFLDFAPRGSRRIAYSSSFGKDKLENDEVEETRELLTGC